MLKVLGWIFAPIFMIVYKWKNLKPISTILGIVWSILSLLLFRYLGIVILAIVALIWFIRKKKPLEQIKNSSARKSSRIKPETEKKHNQTTKKCVYCHEPIKGLRIAHSECKHKNKIGRKKISEVIETVGNGADLSTIHNQVEAIAAENFVKPSEVQQAVLEGWEKSIELVLEDRLLDHDEERNLHEIIDTYNLKEIGCEETRGYNKIIKASILRDVMEGVLPDNFKEQVNLPFNFLKSEKLVWVFPNVEYHELKTKREYVGGSSGVSMRVAKGLYVRTGGMRGHSEEYDELVHVDNGVFAVTDKHLYFSGTKKNFRVKFDKIVSFQPYTDALGFQRDAQTAKPQLFKMRDKDDPWFAYNLISNIANM